MSAPFAALEARANSAVLSRLANMDATLGWESVQGIFDSAYAQANVGLLGMASTAPVFTLPTSSLVGDPIGLTLLLDSGALYKVAAHEPDGTGLSRLILEAA